MAKLFFSLAKIMAVEIISRSKAKLVRLLFAVGWREKIGARLHTAAFSGRQLFARIACEAVKFAGRCVDTQRDKKATNSQPQCLCEKGKKVSHVKYERRDCSR